MSEEKILSLKLYYKGKNLDVAKEERDIKDKFVIGSDKSIQWQILDRSFPKKHLLIKKAKDGFRLILTKGMQLTVKKGEQLLDESSLKSQRLLKGNELQLDKDTNGYINFAGDWSIAYEFVKPYRKILTEDDRRLISQYNRRPGLSDQEKLSRNMLIIAILIMLIGAILFENLYEPPVFERSLAQRVFVEPAPIEREPEVLTFQEDVPVPEVTEEVGEPSEAVDRPSGAASVLGFDPGAVDAPVAAVPSGPQVVTYSEQIVGRGTGGAPGTGPGGSAVVPGRAGASFDPGQIAPSGVAPGTVFQGDIDTARRMGMRDMDASVLGGMTGEIQATEITTTTQLQALARARARADAAGLETVTEAAIESAEPEVRAGLASMKQYIQVNFRQIDELFKQETQIRRIYGSIEATLYFAPNGQVDAVDIQPRPGSFFTESFLTKARELMMQWRVPANQQLPPYRFPYRFH